MTTLLLLAADPDTATRVESLATAVGIGVRTVSTYEATRDFLSRQTFDILLIDLETEPLRSVDLLELAWKYSPSLSGGIFSFSSPPVDTWNATLIGAKVFFGPGTPEKLEDYFSSFPKDISLATEKRSAVLVVEDLDSPRDIVKLYIESLGFEHVDAVGSAQAALDTLAGAPELYFCVVADIHMPKMNGIRLTAEIRKDPALKNLPVVILTSDPTAENVIECVKAGASGFLAKPPKKSSLLRELEKAKRMVVFKQSPRLCAPEDAEQLGTAVEPVVKSTGRSRPN